MSLSFFWILIVFFYFDIQVLKKIDKDLYEQKFKLKPHSKILFLLLLGLLISIGVLRDMAEIFTSFAVLVILPVYLFRRREYLISIRKDLPWIQEQDNKKGMLQALDAFSIVLAWMVASLVITGILHAVFGLNDSKEAELAEIVFTAVFSSFCMVYLIIRKVRRYPPAQARAVMGFGKGRQPMMVMIATALFFGLVCAFISSYVLVTRDVQPETPLSEILENSSSSMALMLFLLAAVLMAPFMEEIIFRGYFYHVIERMKGKKVAVFLISSIFAFLHFNQYWGDWVAIFMVTVLGFILTSLRAWTGTAVISIMTHYVYNISVTIMPILLMLHLNPAFFEYQRSYDQLNYYQKEALLIESISRQPQFSEAYNDLAWLYAQEGKNLPRALGLADKALSLSPHRHAFLDTKSEVLYQMGKVDEAVAIQKQLMKEDPENVYYQEQWERFNNTGKVSDEGQP